MKSLSVIAAVAAAVLVLGAPSATAATTHLHGGGTASISQVAFNVTFSGSGAASGTFNCLMAGRSKFVLPALGLKHIMKVQARPNAGSISGSTATFTGPALLIMDGGQHKNVHVSVWANVATQQFQLTVVEVGAMPVENFLSGGIEMN